MRRMRWLRAGPLAIVGIVALAPLAAYADEPASAERLKAAAEEFDRGRRAYLAKDFDQAAGHFESAFRDAPRAETLRLAIRARREAKQPARAATLAAIAKERYGTDGPTDKLATETLAEGTPQLQEYLVECSVECSLSADGRVVSQSDALHQRVFLDPGGHDLGVSFRQGASSSRHVEAKKGAKETLHFEPTAAPAPSEAPSPPSTEKPPPPPPSQKPLSPIVFFIGAGLTAVGGAATIVSGVDAQNNPGTDAVRRECGGKDESCSLYQEGERAETRTNVLLGATIGLAVVTGVVGLFFTRWSSAPSRDVGAVPKRSTMRVTPGGLALRF